MSSVPSDAAGKGGGKSAGYASATTDRVPSKDKKKQVVVIVDPYSSGRFLVSELKSQQWKMVCIQSSQDLADFWLAQMEPENFVENIRHQDFDTTMAAIKKYDIAAVLPGSEPGVLLAEDLQEALKLPCNGASTKAWRRNKYDMQERLREVGIRAVRQLYSSEVDETLAWQQQWGKWPIIVKPSMSGGTDGVYWCHNGDDIREAFNAECGKLNCNGVVNDKLLGQEYLDGLEYIVDCVSFEGKHVLSGMWVYQKIKDPKTRSITYEYARIIESTGEVQDKLVEYVFKCLDALSFLFGPSHSEVIMCEDGPCLVETGARMHGLKGPKMTELATGIGTHELVVDVILNNGRIFKELYDRNFRYIVKKWAFETMMNNRCKSGILKKSIEVPEFKDYPSFLDVFPSVQPGQELKLTRDLATAPGIILQVHASLQQCMDDISRLRKLEETTLYEVTAEPKRRTDSTASDASARSPMCTAQASPFSCMSPRHEKSGGQSLVKRTMDGNSPVGSNSEEGNLLPDFVLDGMDDEQ